jgi:hypothetical protein
MAARAAWRIQQLIDPIPEEELLTFDVEQAVQEYLTEAEPDTSVDA